MLGRRVNPNHFIKHPETMTLGRWFRRHGYQTFSVGKIDHTEEYVDPQAWDIRVGVVRPDVPLGPLAPWDEDLGRQRRRISLIGIADSSAALVDHARVDRTIRFLDEERDPQRPFFAAVGFHAPHVPWNTTRACYDRHDPATFTLEPTPTGASLLPRGSLHYEPGLEMTADRQREGMRAYYAAVTALDEQIGRLLAAFADRGLLDDTLVVLTSDHGYHLGWRGQWCKHSIDEQVMRVPLVVRHPRGRRSVTAAGIVELLDLFPTFCAAAGLAAPEGLDGRSFLPLVMDPDAPGKPGGYCRWGNGRTVRTERWRYVERDDGSCELYDHAVDEAEYFDVADLPDNERIVREHAAMLAGVFGPRPPARGGDAEVGGPGASRPAAD